MLFNGLKNPLLAALDALATGGDDETDEGSAGDRRGFDGFTAGRSGRPAAANARPKSKGCVCPGRSALSGVRRSNRG